MNESRRHARISGKRLRHVVASIGVVVAAYVGPVNAEVSETLADLLKRSGRYVSQSGHTLAVVICDEEYRQDVWSDGTRVQIRTMTSEMLFLQLADEDMWLAVRNVLSVDGRTVPHSRERLDRAFAAGPRDYVPRLRQLQIESARYDIGVARTVGNRIVVLRFMLPSYQPRFAFGLVGYERIGGLQVAKVSFLEKMRPAAIRFNDSDMLTSGAVWVRPSDGAVVKTQLRGRTPTRLNVSITAEFGRDAKLAHWVPRRLEERYVDSGGETTATAKYSNYRRFESSARLITPAPR